MTTKKDNELRTFYVGYGGCVVEARNFEEARARARRRVVSAEERHENPAYWTIYDVCDALEEVSDKTEIESAVWDLREAVFVALKQVGKLAMDAEGPENQEYVNKVMAEMVERV